VVRSTSKRASRSIFQAFTAYASLAGCLHRDVRQDGPAGYCPHQLERQRGPVRFLLAAIYQELTCAVTGLRFGLWTC